MIVVLVRLAGLFGMLSLLAFGSANSVIPDMQRAAVQTYGWMTDRDFLDLFAISRVAPGPGSLIVALVGQRAAGLAGAAVATLAMFGPSSLLVHAMAGLWHRAREARWRGWVEQALAPIAIGLVFASVIGLVRGTEHGLAPLLLTGLAGAVLTASEIQPLIVLAAGAAAGWWLGL